MKVISRLTVVSSFLLQNLYLKLRFVYLKKICLKKTKKKTETRTFIMIILTMKTRQRKLLYFLSPQQLIICPNFIEKNYNKCSTDGTQVWKNEQSDVSASVQLTGFVYPGLKQMEGEAKKQKEVIFDNAVVRFLVSFLLHEYK